MQNDQNANMQVPGDKKIWPGFLLIIIESKREREREKAKEITLDGTKSNNISKLLFKMGPKDPRQVDRIFNIFNISWCFLSGPRKKFGTGNRQRK